MYGIEAHSYEIYKSLQTALFNITTPCKLVSETSSTETFLEEVLCYLLQHILLLRVFPERGFQGLNVQHSTNNVFLNITKLLSQTMPIYIDSAFKMLFFVVLQKGISPRILKIEHAHLNRFFP